MLTRYHSVSYHTHGYKNRHSVEYGQLAYTPVPVTEDDSGFLTNLFFDIQIAAPGGFSIHLADPALTAPGFAASMDGFTRSHHCLC